MTGSKTVSSSRFKFPMIHWPLTTEDHITMMSKKAGTNQLVTVPHPRRTEPSNALLWKPKNLQKNLPGLFQSLSFHGWFSMQNWL